MRPLTLDDLIPLEEFIARRAEFFDSHRRYLDRYRRVRIGPSVTLIFENRQTLWFKLHEILRVSRLADPVRVQRELDWYNAQLPGRGRLRASMLLDDESRPIDELLKDWSTFAGSELKLVAGREETPAVLVTTRPEDRTLGTAHAIEFAASVELRAALIGGVTPCWCEMNRPNYDYRSQPLNASLRQSLEDDLALSDRG